MTRKPKMSALEKKQRDPFSRYWKIRAVEAFMKSYRGQQCEVCASLGKVNTYGTVAHHLIPKGRTPCHIITPENIVVLCVAHHRMGNDICAHSGSMFVVNRFIEWMKRNKPVQYIWAGQHQWDTGKVDWKARYEQITGAKA